jgi:transcriptional regulator with XRE-family HTH domain
MTAETTPGTAGRRAEPGSARRAELGHFLRTRRAQLDPAMVGFPTGARRRAPGLLREEVAALAGMSTTWYTYLEQGRDIRPSPEVIDALATALELDEDQRRYVHRLAAGADPSPGISPDGSHLQIDPADVVAELGSGPGPGPGLGPGPGPFYASRQNADIVAWNDATVTWFTDFGAVPPGQRNMLRWMITDPAARYRFPFWEAEVRDVVARMRANLPARQADPPVDRLVAELSAVSPDFRRLWEEHHIAGQRARYRQLRHPELGIRLFRVAVLRAADDAGLIYVAHLPVAC